MEKIIGEAQPLADAARGSHGFVGEHGHDSLRAAGTVVQFSQSLKRVKYSFVGVGEVELVLAIVLEKECVGFGEKIFVDLFRSNVGGEGQRAAHEHRSAV